LQDIGSGFNSDTNKITIIGKDNKTVLFELKPKNDVAKDIIDYLENNISK
jgi:phosphopantothenoylcysteine decarboxylase/phosphopantothenate--cysteine ligase